MKNLTPLEILQAWLDENGGTFCNDEDMVRAALEEEGMDDRVKIAYDPPDYSVGIRGGHYIESGSGEFTLEWWDDEWPELQEAHKFERSKSIITKVHYSRKEDFSVEEGEDIPYTVNVQLEEAHIERVRVKVVRDGRHHIAYAYRVTARYEWEAGDE